LNACARTYIIDTSLLLLSVGEGARICQAASLILFKVPAQARLILDIGHLVFVVALLEVAFFTSVAILVILLATTGLVVVIGVLPIAIFLLIASGVGMTLLSLRLLAIIVT